MTNFKMTSSLTGVLALIVLPNTQATAQDQASADDGTIEEIVVTATRREESLQRIPVSVTALTGDDLTERGLKTTWDLAAATPGLNITGPFNQSSPQISVRGVGNNGFNANVVSTVGVYTDEVYLNSSVAQGFQMFDLERVELLRGPQGTLYGVNTTSGALNFVSVKPGDEFTLDGHATYGDFDEFNIEAALNVPLGEKIAFRGAVAFNKRDGYKENVTLGVDAGFRENFSWRGQLSFDVADNLEILLRLNGGSARNDGASYKQQGVIDPATFGFCGDADIAAGNCMDFFGHFEPQEFYTVSSDLLGFENLDALGAAATINWDVADFTVTSITAFGDNERDTADDLDASPFDQLHDQFVSDAEQFSQEFRLTSSNSEQLSWIVGAYYFEEKMDEFIPIPARAYGPGGLTGGFSPFLEGVYSAYALDTESWALFGDATFAVNDRLKIRAGLRYTNENKDIDFEAGIFNADGTDPSTVFTLEDVRARTFFPTIDRVESESWDKITGRIAVEYSMRDDVLLYASYARGFRGGNFNSGALFADAEFTIVDPETLDSFEIGIKSTILDGKATLNASGFYYQYDDQQVTQVQGGVPLLDNAAASTIWGGEVEFVAKPSAAIDASLGLALMDATYDEFIGPTGADLSGNKLENAPDVTLNGLVSYTINVSDALDAVIQTDISYKGAHFLDFSNSPLSRQEGTWLHNASLSIGANDGRFKASVWMRNIWDEKYLVNWADLSAFGFNVLTQGVPRTFGISLSASM